MAGTTPAHSIKPITQLWGSVWHTSYVAPPCEIIQFINSLQQNYTQDTNLQLWTGNHPRKMPLDYKGREGMSFSRSSLWPVWEQILTTEANIHYAINFYIAQPTKEAKYEKPFTQCKKRYKETSSGWNCLGDSNYLWKNHIQRKDAKLKGKTGSGCNPLDNIEGILIHVTQH